MAAPPLVWRPDEAMRRESNVARFMIAEHIDDFATLVSRSIAEPEWFWDAVVRYLGLPFDTPYERVLDTYEPERIAFAQRLVATTDRAFQLVTSDGPLARFVRLHVVPRVLPPLFKSEALRRVMFRTVSQTSIQYRSSALSDGGAGGVRAGDRLPWAELTVGNRNADNYEPFRALDWQVHVYGEAPAAISASCRARAIALHVFPWQDTLRQVGFERNAFYLVRPDGYVAFASTGGDSATFERYLDAWAVRPRAARESGLAE